MRTYRSLAAVSALSLALAACSSGDQDEASASDDAAEIVTEDELAAVEGEGDVIEDAADGEAEDGAEEAVAEPSDTPTPAPSAAASAPAVAMAAPTAFTQCAICHSVEAGKNGIGPTLAGVVGRRSAAVAGFSYSPAMREAGLTWNEATLQRYLGDPAGVVPGTTMALPGIPAADRTAIINYLKTK